MKRSPGLPSVIQPTEIESKLAEACRSLNTAVGSRELQRLVQWIGLVVMWNRKIDLTAARSVEELIDLCVADALVLSRSIQAGQRVVDVGSGAGAPGLPLGLMIPDALITLVEPLSKRISFLRTVVGTVGVSMQVQRARGESVGSGYFDIALSRATLEPSAWLRLGARLVQPGGKVAVLLARHEPPQHEGLEVCEKISYCWPLTGVERHLLWYRQKS